MAFWFKEHTADVTIQARNSSYEQAFADVAVAVTQVMTQQDVACISTHDVCLQAESLEALLFELVSELVFLLDTESLFVASASFEIVETAAGWQLSGEVCGDDASLYQRSGGVKAATYNQLVVRKEGDEVFVSLTVDL